MNYRVKAGRHVEEGHVYTKDQVVTSDRELDKLFLNKFERVQEWTPPIPKIPEEVKLVPAPQTPTRPLSEPPPTTATVTAAPPIVVDVASKEPKVEEPRVESGAPVKRGPGRPKKGQPIQWDDEKE